MKTAFAAVAALASAAAFAQSSPITLFGSIDLNLTYSKVGGQSAKAMDQGGYMLPSRIGFRGVEDLGDGLQAAFWIESALLPDTGQSQAAFWGRRSTVGLIKKGVGEIRLGRDYVPTFWNVSSFAPFGTVGVGGSSNIIEGWPLGPGGARTQTRASNQVSYFLPRDLGGVYGQLTAAAAEGTDGARYVGGRIGYESGPLNVAAAYGTTPVGDGDYRATTVGGSYDFGAVKAFANVFEHELADDKQRNLLLGASLALGPGQLKASLARSDRSGAGVDADDATQFAIGYAYLLSKRTTLYGAWSRIDNDGNAAYVAADSSPAGVPGQRSTGLQFGVRHDF